MPKQFKESDIRVGWLIDPLSEEIRSPATIEYTHKGVLGTINLALNDNKIPYQDTYLAQTQNLEKTKKTIPETLFFADAYGYLCLWRCRRKSYSATAYGEELKFFARIAVNSKDFYEETEVIAMGSTGTALLEWFNFEPLDTTIHHESHTKIESSFIDSEPIMLSPSMKLQAILDWQINSTHTSIVGNTWPAVKTCSSSKTNFTDHFLKHQQLYTLLAISSWAPCYMSKILISNDTDMQTKRWINDDLDQVHTSNRFICDCNDNQPDSYLFNHKNMKKDSYTKWFNLYESNRRTMESLTNILYSTDPWNPEFILTLGPVLERIGFELAKNSNSKNKDYFSGRPSQIPFRSSLEAIADLLPNLPINDTQKWIDQTRNSYITWKHADRKPAPLLEVLSSIKDSLLIIRFWICHEIGIDLSEVEKNLKTDSLYKIYFK